MRPTDLGWLGIVRLGLIQMSLGAIVVLTTSTLNRVMAVELALPAALPAALVVLHHAMQLLRPRMGYGADLGRRHTPWIVGGMATLAAGGALAAVATAWMATRFLPGLALAIVAFAAIGVGVSASGTALLTLMAKRVPAERRGAAATVVWVMMIFGFAFTSGIAGRLLDPFSGGRLVAVTGGVSIAAFLVALIAVAGLEGKAAARDGGEEGRRPDFLGALREVWGEPDARHFTLFVFVSMMAYSGQDLILEPFAGSRFTLSPGESTKLSSVQHGGVLVGMLLVAIVTSIAKGRRAASLKGWVLGGCVGSATALAGLAMAGLTSNPWPLRENVFLLGVANGAFSIAAIGAMMALAGRGRTSREGVRMGLWGASQAIAFAAGGFLGAVLADGARWILRSTGAGYSFVFALEAVSFLWAAGLALKVAFGPRSETAGLGAVELVLAKPGLAKTAD